MRDQNMADVDVSGGPTMVWVGQSVMLKDFKHNYTTPNIVRIVQGEYMNIGANTSSGEVKASEVLLHSIQNTTKVLALNMRLTDGRRVDQTSQKLSIPMTYQGWFEVLSEDGRVIRAIETIADLVKISPHTCLVRENIRAYISKENGELSLDRYRVVQAGETLTLFGVLTTTVTTQQGRQELRFLRCLDYKGASAFFRFDQKGLFSPVAGKGNISGVHTIQGILNKFHLPLTVRLVFGTYPKQLPKGKFCGIIRLLYVYQDETAFVCPAAGDYRMLPISTEVQLKVMPALNFEEMKDEERVKSVWERCSKMARSYLNTIHALYDVNVPPPTNSNLSNPYVTMNEGAERLWEQESKGAEIPKEEEDQLMDEVEDIYLYVVRHGVSPPPMQTRNTSTDPGDKDYWEEPVYNTLHRKKDRRRDSLTDVVKRLEAKDSAQNKVFRFHPQPNHGMPGRGLSFVRTNQERIDKVVAIAGGRDLVDNDVPPPVPPKLFEKKSHSLENLADVGTEEVATRKMIEVHSKQRRKSQPAIMRIFKKSDKKSLTKDKDGSGSHGSGNSGDRASNSTEEDTRVRKSSKLAVKLKQMYV